MADSLRNPSCRFDCDKDPQYKGGLPVTFAKASVPRPEAVNAARHFERANKESPPSLVLNPRLGTRTSYGGHPSLKIPFSGLPPEAVNAARHFERRVVELNGIEPSTS